MARPVRILIHTLFYRPEHFGVAVYSTGLAEFLAGRGHIVRVVCGPPHYPQWKAHVSYKIWKYTTETLSGVAVTRCPLWIPRKPSFWKRTLYSVVFALTSLPALVRELILHPDVIITFEPSFLSSLVSLGLSKCAGIPCWLHIQDFEVDIALGGRRNRLRSLAVTLESWLLNRFDRVLTISGQMYARLEQKGVRRERCQILPNWVDTRAVFPSAHMSDFRRQHNLPGEKVVA